MVVDPGVVGGHVVRHKIEEEPEATICESCTGCAKARGATKMLVDNVAAHAVGRADIVLCRKVG